MHGVNSSTAAEHIIHKYIVGFLMHLNGENGWIIATTKDSLNNFTHCYNSYVTTGQSAAAWHVIMTLAAADRGAI